MISSAFLVLALVAPSADAAPAEAPSEASSPKSTVAALDERITLRLEKADLSQVLERLATLLGKTLILQPGVEGLVTIDAPDMPVTKVLQMVMTSSKVSIRLEGDRMFVSRTGENPPEGPGRPGEDELSRAFLADASLPRRPAAEKPPRFAGAFEFRAEGAGAPTVWELGDTLGTVTLPGCAAPIPVVLLPGDLFDGIPRIVFADAGRGGQALARIVAPEGTVRLPECAAPLSVRTRASKEGSPKAVPLRQSGTYMLKGRLREVRADSEEVLSEPRVGLPVGVVGTMKSGTQSVSSSGAPLNQVVVMHVGILSATDDDAFLVCSVSVVRDVEPAPGQPPVTIRVARADESLRVTYGKTERVTVSSTYGRGQSALVLELTLEKIPEKR